MVSEEAFVSDVSIPYDEVTYRSPDERYKIDPEIAKDLKAYGFRR